MHVRSLGLAVVAQLVFENSDHVLDLCVVVAVRVVATVAVNHGGHRQRRLAVRLGELQQRLRWGGGGENILNVQQLRYGINKVSRRQGGLDRSSLVR